MMPKFATWNRRLFLYANGVRSNPSGKAHGLGLYSLARLSAQWHDQAQMFSTYSYGLPIKPRFLAHFSPCLRVCSVSPLASPLPSQNTQHFLSKWFFTCLATINSLFSTEDFGTHVMPVLLTFLLTYSLNLTRTAMPVRHWPDTVLSAEANSSC